MPAHRTGHFVKCVKCGADVYRTPSEIKASPSNRSYCSTKCRNERAPIIINGDGTALVPLYRGGGVAAHTIIDAADAEWASQWRWSLRADGYAVRSERIGGCRRKIRLHRALLGLEYNDNLEGDHKDRNRLNNRRENLRTLPKGLNSQNVPGFGGSSRHRGVYFNKQTGKWTAYINIPGGKMKYLGQFALESDAAEVAQRARFEFMPAAVD